MAVFCVEFQFQTIFAKVHMGRVQQIAHETGQCRQCIVFACDRLHDVMEFGRTVFVDERSAVDVGEIATRYFDNVEQWKLFAQIFHQFAIGHFGFGIVYCVRDDDLGRLNDVQFVQQSGVPMIVTHLNQFYRWLCGTKQKQIETLWMQEEDE